MALRIYIAFHPTNYKAARTIGEALSGQHSVYGESIGADSAAVAGIDALQDADLHLYLLSPASVKAKAFRQRYALSRQSGARTLPILIAPLPPRAALSGSYIDATNQLETLLPQLQRYAAELDHSKRSANAPWYQRRILLPLAGVLLMILVIGIFAMIPRETTPAPNQDGLMVAEASEEATEALSMTDTATSTATPTNTATASPTPEAADEVPDESAYDVQVAEATVETILEETEEAESFLFADFYADPLDGVAPLTVFVENYSQGDIIDYAWDFDEDGIIDSTEANPQPFTYIDPGDYLLTLTIWDEDGNEESYSEYILVYPSGAGGGNGNGGGG
ncbi:MAG: PKD domain-containing protein, partial [Anaerolineae bacterium]|nr:PKD domain-containing protein [Anaerolineae bacterium]